jgi:hypothetical protein
VAEPLKTTHVMIAEPEMGVRYLADYMAGYERKKRAVLVDAKYRSRLKRIRAPALVAKPLYHLGANVRTLGLAATALGQGT